MIRFVAILGVLVLFGCTSPKGDIVDSTAQGSSQANAALLGLPLLESGVYDAIGNLNDLTSLQIEITEHNEFIATFVWWSDLPGPNGLEQYTTKVGGMIKSPRQDVIIFTSPTKSLRWPLDQEFSALSKSELRIESGYWTVAPGGRLYRRPEDATYIYLRKRAEPGATDNPDDAQRLREDH